MKNSSYFKIASTLLALSVFAGCASLPMQQGEYDDVYFTSADRAQLKKVVIDPEGTQELGENVVTLERSSDQKVEANLIDKYNNGASQEVVYFEAIDPKVSRASELNYDDFVWDYENELLKNYDLPLDWDDMDPITFNQIVRDDFQFRNAWYDQYYRGFNSAMENYLTQASSFNTPYSRARNWNFNVGFGLGFGSIYNSSVFWGSPYSSSIWIDPFWRFGSPYAARFGYSFYDPFFYDPFFNDPWFVSSYGLNSWRYRNWNWRRGNTIIIANNEYYNSRGNRDYTRGARVPSTSITSVRSDAANGTSNTRSSQAALNNSSRSRSTISRGRVSNTSVRPVTTSSTRSSRSTTSIDQALSRSSNRVRTDSYRISTDGKSRSSSGYSIGSLRRSSNSGRSSGLTYNTSSRTRTSIPSYTRTSSSRRSSGVSFSRGTSSRSSSPTFSRSSRSSSSRSYSYGRSSSSSRSSGSYSRSSSSSSSRSSGSVSRSSSSSSRSSSSGSSRSSSSGSSRSGRGGN
ncbi:hypothetical protein [Roseivirga spongicola]|uniref:hypothetical protein n=1 Tax=Roseivirga spongicola TaxID=333140 RepID=UPI002AC8D73B|nr:hypothetical protein [Roseivirga spongicola]WPZ08873.1 hypothetical protein T7867_11465 [Roseivirga spongicola]